MNRFLQITEKLKVLAFLGDSCRFIMLWCFVIAFIFPLYLTKYFGFSRSLNRIILRGFFFVCFFKSWFWTKVHGKRKYFGETCCSSEVIDSYMSMNSLTPSLCSFSPMPAIPGFLNAEYLWSQSHIFPCQKSQVNHKRTRSHYFHWVACLIFLLISYNHKATFYSVSLFLIVLH